MITKKLTIYKFSYLIYYYLKIYFVKCIKMKISCFFFNFTTVSDMSYGIRVRETKLISVTFNREKDDNNVFTFFFQNNYFF